MSLNTAQTPNNRIKSLDGIRAIAIIMVLLTHAAVRFPKFITDNNVFGFFADGYKGVQIFFVLSGYLITKLLIIEREKTNTINIKDFYIRRAYRILPIFFVYILVVVLLKLTVLPDIFSSYFSIVIVSLYIWNFHHAFEKLGWHENQNGLTYFGHFWSLSIEEQYYLAWPFLFKHVSAAKLKKITIILLIVFPVVRTLLYCFTPFKTVEGFMHDAILVGSLGAIIESNPLLLQKITTSFRYNIWALIAFIVLFVANPILDKHFRGGFGVPIGISLNSFLIMYLIFWSIYKKSKIQTFLNWKVMTGLGVISYSIYVWQQLIFFQDVKTKVSVFPLNLILVFGIAFCSYYFLEKPVINLRRKFTPKKLRQADVNKPQ